MSNEMTTNASEGSSGREAIDGQVVVRDLRRPPRWRHVADEAAVPLPRPEGFMKRSGAVLLSLAMLFTSLIMVSPAGAAGEDLGDEELAEAVAFQTGPGVGLVGQDISELMSLGELRQYRTMARGLIDDLARAELLAPIIDELRSGNPMLVEAALTDLGDALMDAAEQRFGADAVERALRPDQDVAGYGACSFALVCVAYVAAAVHNTVAATAFVVAAAGGAVALAAVVWKAKWIWNGQVDGSSSLYQDRYVADLTKTLAR